MYKYILSALALCCLWSCQPPVNQSQNTEFASPVSNNTGEASFATAYVDPFQGTTYGNVFPGACRPFGLVRLGPDVPVPQPTSGYRKGKPYIGFSHMHVSGTGGSPRYGNILVAPQVGSPHFEDNAGSPRNEYARPGIYSVELGRKPGDVAAKLTTTSRAAFHEYEFFTWTKDTVFQASILFNLSHVLSRGDSLDHRCTYASVRITSPQEVSGYGHYEGGWGVAAPYKVYFAAQLSRPFDTAGVWGGSQVLPGQDTLSGQKVGAYFTYQVKQKEKITVKVGISLTSIEEAKTNLKTQLAAKSFNTVRNEADAEWGNLLRRIHVSGGSQEDKALFYTLLYHTMITPVDITEDNPRWQSSGPSFWDHYCLWDVFRGVMPLYTLIMPEQQQRIINSLLDVYEQTGWLPDAWIAGHHNFVQGGSNADVVIADAIAKNLGGFDKELAYQAIKKNGTVISSDPYTLGRDLTAYKDLGYCTTDQARCLSRSLEYAYNDFCIGQVARTLGKSEDYNYFKNRSLQVFNLFDEQSGFFLARDAAGNPDRASLPPHQPKEKYSDAPYYYEGDGWIYGTYTPHAIGYLIEKFGGNEAFISHLDKLFDEGHYDLGNEPSMLSPYLYNYAGQPHKTAERVQHLMRSKFKTGRRGLPGQDDSGALSSWFVWSSLGIFPVAGQDVYLIGSPLFKESEIELGRNKTFIIQSNNLSDENIYVQRALLNGVELRQSWFTHDQIFDGGRLILEMGSKPGSWATSSPPPSLFAEE